MTNQPQTNVTDLWFAFCHDCEGSLAEGYDYSFLCAIADIHSAVNRHLVSLTTYKDRRPNTKEVPRHDRRADPASAQALP